MTAIKERILLNLSTMSMCDISEHKDLIAFCVNSDCFETIDELEEGLEADFNELIVITEKEWLFDRMKKDQIKDPLLYLKNEYTSDESIEWFEDAVAERKIVLVGFN